MHRNRVPQDQYSQWDLLESGETDTEVVQETLDEAVCGINDLQEEFDEHDSEIETVARECIAATVAYILEVELKNYQKRVLHELDAYISLLNSTKNLNTAYNLSLIHIFRHTELHEVLEFGLRFLPLLPDVCTDSVPQPFVPFLHFRL